VNGSTGSGPTPLTGAVDDGSTELVKFLLEAGADPNDPGEVTSTLLFVQFYDFGL
jgi:ankyrin repeat protein